MKNSEASYTITLDKRRSKSDGTFPVKLRVMFKKVRKRYNTGLYLTPEDFQKSYLSKPIQKKHKEINKQFRDLTKEVDEILENIGQFTFEKFESRIQTKSSKNDLFSSFDLYINKLRKEKRISTANSYLQAKTSIRKYTAKKILSFEEVNSSFLRKYEAKMVKDGRSVSTVGIYLRYVRNLFNIAIREELVKADYYPFCKGKYQIANTPKTYKALTNEDLKKLFNEPVEDRSIEQFYRDLWFFSYFGNGINTKDMLLLKFGNIRDNIIHFKRAKTILTNRTAPEGEIPIIAPLKRIIEQWGNNSTEKDNYIFPILKPDMNDDQILKTVHQTNKQITKYIRKIARRAGINEDISAQYARHTFTTRLVQSGVPLSTISKRLVHESIDTTSKYIGRNSSLQEFEISNMLIP